NLMIFSRPHVKLDDFFPNAQIINIRATETDMAQYINCRISNSPRLSKHVGGQSQLHNEIHTIITQNAEGMFLLAKLHIDLLAAKLTVRAVREGLKHLPKDLNRTYDEAMERIDNQKEDEKELAHLVLMWVANSKRPLSVGELQEALAIEPGSTSLDVENIPDIDTILSVCAGLVI
ncbi:hypothetical protein B0H19DRAFT_863901, partial [Mycena capillaripes]